MIENQSIKKLRPHLQKLQEQNDLEARKRGWREGSIPLSWNNASILKAIVESQDLDFLGAGGEVVVIQNSELSSEFVQAINYENLTPEKAKEIFYLQRIFSTLFPDHFPRFKTVYGTNSHSRDFTSGSIRRKVTQETRSALDKTLSLNDVVSQSEKIGINLNDMLDWAPGSKGNIIVGISQSGESLSEYYADTIAVPRNTTWDLQKLYNYLVQSKDVNNTRPRYTDIDKKIIINSIKRLLLLRPDIKIK